MRRRCFRKPRSERGAGQCQARNERRTKLLRKKIQQARPNPLHRSGLGPRLFSRPTSSLAPRWTRKFLAAKHEPFVRHDTGEAWPTMPAARRLGAPNGQPHGGPRQRPGFLPSDRMSPEGAPPCGMSSRTMGGSALSGLGWVMARATRTLPPSTRTFPPSRAFRSCGWPRRRRVRSTLGARPSPAATRAAFLPVSPSNHPNRKITPFCGPVFEASPRSGPAGSIHSPAVPSEVAPTARRLNSQIRVAIGGSTPTRAVA